MNNAVYDRISRSLEYRDTRDLINELYGLRGASQRTIATLIGCSIPTVKALIKQFKVMKSITAKTIPIPDDALVRCSCGELAARYKISKSHAWRLKKAILGRTLLRDEEA